MEHGGQRVGRGQDLQDRDDLRAGVAQDLLVLGAEQPGPPVELLGVGELLDEGEVVERDGVRVDVEAAAFELGRRAQVDHGADPERAQDGQVTLGQLAQPVGAEQDAPAGALPVLGGVAAQVAEVHRALQGDEPLRRVGRHETGMSHMGNQRLRSGSKGRSAPTMERMRSSSSVSRRSFSASTGAKG